MLARTYIACVAIAAVALVSMTSAAPAGSADITTIAAVAQELEGPDFLPVPKDIFPLCCIHKIADCCLIAKEDIKLSGRHEGFVPTPQVGEVGCLQGNLVLVMTKVDTPPSNNLDSEF
ncbi:MAG: hypothetical protein J3Q66DRAFT_446187 [Benniella sp.]|nr:MAG: hypothetical protein J3Q66DRAFT_446187 [Benniella sp.]